MNIFFGITFLFFIFSTETNASGGGSNANRFEREEQGLIAARIASAYNAHLIKNAQRAAGPPPPPPPPTTTKTATTTPKLTTITSTTTAKPTTTTTTTTAKPTTTTTTTTTTKTTTTITMISATTTLSCPFSFNIICNSSYRYQSFDGTCNNLNNPAYGSANTPYTRFLTPVYADGVNSPRNSSVSGASLPNPRNISTNLFTDQFASEKIWLHFFTVSSFFIKRIFVSTKIQCIIF